MGALHAAADYLSLSQGSTGTFHHNPEPHVTVPGTTAIQVAKAMLGLSIHLFFAKPEMMRSCLFSAL